MLVIPDLHCPYEHPKALEFLIALREKWKTDTTICLGDEIDGHCFSTKFLPNPDLPGPHDELMLAKESLSEIADHFPEMEIIESNHSTRIVKKALSAGLPSMVLKLYGDIIGAPPGWRFHEIGYDFESVHYTHGEGFSQGSWKTAFNKMRSSVCMGHLHSGAGIQLSQTRRNRFFTMNTGCLINPAHKAFNYARFSHERACLGAGIIIDGEEVYFIPMPEKMAGKEK